MSQRPAPRRHRRSVSQLASSNCSFERLEVRRLMAVTLPPSKGTAAADQKIGDVLGYLASDFATRPLAAQPRSNYQNQTYALAADQPNRSLIRTSGDSVLIRAVAKADVAGVLATQLKNLGATVNAAYGSIFSAAVPISLLGSLNNLSALLYADASYAPITRAGKTDDLGVQAMNADKAQKQYGVSGSGVRVGILSDSYNLLGGASAGVTSGDLPAGGVTVVKEGPSGDGADEGRGMAEIVHDVAPGSPISFYSAYYDEADFANGILTLAKPTSAGGQGAKVVVDDIAYFTEPFFQDGVIAQAVNTAYSSYGTSYFSAAGNDGTDSYESVFRPTASMTIAGAGTGVFQDFDPSAATNVYQQITIPAGGSITLAFQWDAPFASASINAGGTAAPANSVGLYLLNQAKTGTVKTAVTSRVGGDAYQILTYDNTTAADQTRYLAMKVTAGTAPGYVKYIDYGGYSPTLQFATSSGTAIGHAVAANGLGVGAAYYANTPAFNVSPAVKESFSSPGGTPLLFAPNGTRYASAVARQQPAIVAPDGAATTFFYEQSTTLDGQYHFSGTSAAAPHAAAVAALLLEANPSLTNAQVYSTLKSTAADMDAAGFDYNTGYGLVQADAALASVAASTIGGRVFRDTNANGAFDASDTAVSGKSVFLDANNNGLADAGNTTLTNGSATAIPDATATYNALSRVSSSIVSGLTGRVTGLSVAINASHARFSDLGFTLITPAGTRIPLLTNLGGLSGNRGTGINATLSDANATYINGVYSTAVLGGAYKPQTPLAAALNESAAGTWQLEARDYKSGTTGTINSWSLTLSYADPTVTTDSNGNYTFSGLTPSTFYGTYRVRTAALSGYIQSTPTSGYDLTLPRSSTITNELFAFTPDTPSVTSLTFNYAATPNTISIVFSKNVSASLSSGDLAVALAGGGAISATYSGYDAVTNTATFTLPTLANGRYTATLAAAGVTDANGTALTADVTLNFFALAGDINHDGSVDVQDLGILSSHWQQSGAGFGNGDLNSDGLVDVADLGILSSNWQVTV